MRDPAAVPELFLYRLMRLTSAARPAVVRLCERQFGITRREWSVVGLLAETDGLSPSALAGQAMLDRARASRVIGSLVDKGFVLRRPVPGNRREATLHLTERGHACYAALMPQVAAINRELLSVLSDAEVAALDSALNRLTAQAGQLGEGG